MAPGSSSDAAATGPDAALGEAAANGAPGGLVVHVRLFAMQRELAGTRSLDLPLAHGASVETAWRALVARFPVLAPGRAALRFAVNGEYADAATILSDGDELACIPPVSGGAAPDRATDGQDPAMRILELRDTAIAPDIVAELSERLVTPEDGAVVGFIGRTRITPGTAAPGQEAEAERHRGREVEGLDYESHDAMALRVLEAIADEIATRFGVRRLAIVHRVGDVPLGDVSVAVVAAAPHRDSAFGAARYAIDETKARAPIWKAERFRDGHVWIGEPARTGPAAGTSRGQPGP